MMGLTKKQTQMMAFIQACMPRSARAPSYCEITAYQRVAVRGAYPHARALSSAGRHRGIRLGPEHVSPAGLPIIGRVTADTPILAMDNLEGYLEIHRLVGERSNLFVLRLKGDSLRDPQIDEGDDVIARAQPWIEHGDVGVVVIDQEVTVTTILHRRTGQQLKPKNLQRGYPPIRLRPQQRVRIVGKVIGNGDVARTAEAARAAACTARGASEATDGGNGLQPRVDQT